jgi:hypothetical protein
MNNFLKIPDDFDVNQYRLLNSDLKDINDNKLKLHYLNHGVNEGRKYKIDLPEDFDVEQYRLLNDDLKNMTNVELVNHYINFGVIEGRKYILENSKKLLPDDFDVNQYRLLNDDLKDLNDKELKDHYLNNGINEDRKYILENSKKLPDDFDVQSYRLLNNDLKNLNDKELKDHYLINGINEGRKYILENIKKLPDDFDIKSYRLLNNDLKNLNDKELKDHYLINGINEGRKYKIELPEDFDVNSYRFFNDDLKNMTNEELVSHYINFGSNEYRKYKSYICQILNGGFGNQLFMLFNIISLSCKYNKDFFVDFDKEYIQKYLEEKHTKRKSSYDYSIFNKNIFKDIYINHLNNFEKYNEEQYIYKEITLDKYKNYILTGYFQSYKYFWEYKDEIKKYINIDQNKVNNINNIYNNFNKKIISIHIRLGDYINLPKFHPIQPIEYYKKALSYYNLENYQIILFSDNIEIAREKLSPLNIHMINADDIFINDEDQFYMLFLSDIIICSNSSFSLMACYFNEIFEFKKDSEYILPNKWFGEYGPKYDMDDFRLNYKFYVIDINNINFDKKFDVVTTIHTKDKERYNKFLKYNKKYIQNVDNFYYISYKNFDIIDSNYISENNYPFSKNDIVDYIKDYIPNERWGWYYQQLLKLYIFKIKEFSYDNILIFDSDILLLNNIYLFENNIPLLFKRNTGNKKVHQPYLESMRYILQNINYDKNDSGICHMMLFNKILLNKLFENIEKIHNKVLWKVCLDSVINYIKINSYNNSILSEYELYYNYIKTKNKYKVINNFRYDDISYDKFNFVLNKNEYTFIADHHYQSSKNDIKDDNKFYF